MGPISEIVGMLPGVNKLKGLNVDDKEITKIEAIINSMTVKERNNISIINGSRRKRIAKGSGTTIQDVNRLLKQFSQTKKMMKNLSKFGRIGKMFSPI
jgi:signal recognition particle subunit SRP54